MFIRSICLLSAAAMALSAPFAVAAAQDTPPQVAATAAGRIPVAEFVKQPNMRSPRISPDGKKLAYRAAANGSEVLAVMDLTNPTKPPRIVLKAEEARESGERTMQNYRWVGNDDLVITVLLRENLYGKLADFSRLVAYNVNSGQTTQQAWRDAGGSASRILYIDHEKGRYLLQRDSVANGTERYGLPEVVDVDVRSGEFKFAQRTNPLVQSWVADSAGVVRGGIGYDRDSGKQRVLYRSGERDTFRTVFNSADKTFTESTPVPEVFIPGTDQAYVTSRQNGYTAIYKADLSTMTLGEPVYMTKGYDLGDVISDDKGTQLIGYRTFDGTHREVYVDPLFKDIQAMLDETFGKNEASIVDYDEKREKFVIFAGGVKRAGGYYIYDVPKADIKLLNWSRVALKDAPLNPVKAEWYTARDGTKIQAIVTYPRHRTGARNLPVVVMPHGGPFGVASATNAGEPWNQPLAEAGYVVIQPNYRGSGGYGKDFEKLGREPGGYGKRMQDDLVDALTWFGKEGTIDPDRACIMGWSYGGYAAARGAQRDGDVWKCAVAGAGIYDMAMMNRWDTVNLGRFSRGFQATSDDPDGISAALHPEGTWAPILIVAAKRDQRIPMEQAETLVAALRRAGKQEGTDFRYIVQEQGTHNLPYDDVHIQWIEEAAKWIERFNPAYIPADKDAPPPLVAFK
ncbi:prolyl oligopeptidase family serine peptidase [Tsuneonella sp. SYSU-LHT278]|uniref:alpha/beta hydrolase family protein n=1 Tax=Tsuneonella sediminis TaxID=3416089 RepID=UPI003F7A865B